MIIDFITARIRSLRRLCFYTCLSFILFTGGVPDQVPPRDQVHPPGPGTPPGARYPPGPGTPPWDQVHPGDQVHPPGTRYTPGTRYAPRPGTSHDQAHTPPDQAHTPLGTRYPPRPCTPPGPGTPPRSRACWEIRSTCGQSASYWNAILFILTLFVLRPNVAQNHYIW